MRRAVRLAFPSNYRYQAGTIVVEPVCVGPGDPICRSDPDPVTDLPSTGDHVWMQGRLVLDTEHERWSELHPLYRWGRG